MREKIVKLIQSQIDDRCHDQTSNYPCPNYAGKIQNDCTYCVADQILSLFEPVELEALLEKAVELIKTWHNGEAAMKLGEEQAEYMWNIYYNHAPEMKEIREAIHHNQSKGQLYRIRE